MGDTIEQLVLSRRGRGNIISYCYDSKWDLPNIERQEGYLGEIYRATMKMPRDIRKRVFDWTPETYKVVRQYVRDKNKDAVSLIIPTIQLEDPQLVWMTAYSQLRFSPQEKPELEELRRQMVFAQAVDAFLRHL